MNLYDNVMSCKSITICHRKLYNQKRNKKRKSLFSYIYDSCLIRSCFKDSTSNNSRGKHRKKRATFITRSVALRRGIRCEHGEVNSMLSLNSIGSICCGFVVGFQFIHCTAANRTNGVRALKTTCVTCQRLQHLRVDTVDEMVKCGVHCCDLS